MRPVIERFDFCSYLVVLLCAAAVARRAGQALPRFERPMWWAGCGVGLGVAALGYVELRPTLPVEVLGIVIVAGIAGCGTALLAALALTPLAAVRDWWCRAAEAARLERDRRRRRRDELAREDAERRRAEADRRARLEAEDEYRRSLPPPPTRDQVADAARDRYERAVRLLEAAGLSDDELDAARVMAKQRYLRELNELMK